LPTGEAGGEKEFTKTRNKQLMQAKEGSTEEKKFKLEKTSGRQMENQEKKNQ